MHKHFGCTPAKSALLVTLLAIGIAACGENNDNNDRSYAVEGGGEGEEVQVVMKTDAAKRSD